MVNEKAQLSKDQGNTAFKAGNYPAAVGHYTAAILADRNDPTYPLNRAAAYLKLGKYDDAERDCNAVLSLSKGNLKALFRRGQARISLGRLFEAQEDLSSVLLIEPSNTSAQEEMKKLATLIQKEKAMKSKAPASVVSPSSAPARRRVPIKILDSKGAVVQTHAVEASSTTSDTKLPNFKNKTATSSDGVSPTKKTNGMLEAVSSRSLKSTTTAPGDAPALIANPSPTTKSANFLDAKAARERPKAGRVGGGIFRASGENTTVGPPEKASDVPQFVGIPSNTLGISKVAYTAPSTLFDFTRTWNSLESQGERWRYLKVIQPGHFPELFKTSLEPALLISILETLLAVLETNKDAEVVKKQMFEYLDALSKVKRFETVVLFLSKAEREIAQRVWHLLGVDRPSGFWKSVV